MNARKRPGLPPEIEEARKISKAEFDAMTPRQQKAALKRFANVNFPILRKKRRPK